MKRAILLTGFNNWGKTTHINDLFGRSRFYSGQTYSIQGVKASFIVESHSNDDYGQTNFVKAVQNKISSCRNSDLFCAFCPTREINNDSKKILTSTPFSSFKEIHILLLENKWDFHAKLITNQIHAYFSGINNIKLFIVNADKAQQSDNQRRNARTKQIISYLKSIYP